MLQYAFRFQSTPGQKHIERADGCRTAECRPDVILIIALQIRTVNDVEQVLPVVTPVFFRKAGSNLLELFHKIAACIYIEPLGQYICNSIGVIVPIFPEIRGPGVGPAAGVSYIKDVFQPGIVAIGVQKRNAAAPASQL